MIVVALEEIPQLKQNSEDAESSDDDCEPEDMKKRKAMLKKIGKMKSRHNVISRRDNLLLVPGKPELQRIESFDEQQLADCADPVEDLSVAKKILGGKVVSYRTLQQDFDLSDIFDYLKTGIACIIEDEVTQRFVSEELKSWNLMSRSHAAFEFINWKLTMFWIGGSFFRYVVLFPGRLMVLVIGVQVQVLILLKIMRYYLDVAHDLFLYWSQLDLT